MKYLLAACCFAFMAMPCHAQIVYPVSSYHATEQDFRYLLLTNQQIEENDTLNEKIVDLVNVIVQDSVIERHKEHHQLPILGWFISVFGNYNWRAVTPVKEKAVGTVKSASRSGAEQFTEYDINFNLFFHLPKYLNHVFKAYDMQRGIARQDFRRHHKTDYSKPPFMRDTANIDMGQYRLHCELTPPRPFRPQLNYLFYPTLPGGGDICDHPGFMCRYPTMGFYGVSCLDCNHNCHPEIHPYEWLWWMNLHTGSVKDKTWMVGLMKDGSARFHHWSHNPKTGKISIPFAFEVHGKSDKRMITIDHLVFDKFQDAEMIKLNLPPTLISTNQQNQTIKLTTDKGMEIPVDINFNNPVITGGLKYWFSDLNWDEQNQVISGYFNAGTSVNDVYTMRVTFSEK